MGIRQSEDDIGTTSRFLTLPAEIRNLILEHCFADSHVLCYYQQRKVGKYLRSTRVEDDLSSFRIRRLGATAHHLLATCRQLRAEALPIYLQQTKFTYALPSRGQYYRVEAVLDFLRRTRLNQVRKLCFPRYMWDSLIVSAFPNLNCVEFGQDNLTSPEDGVSGGFIVEQHSAPWSACQLVNVVKERLKDRAREGGFLMSMHMQWLAEVFLPDRQFRITCFAMMAVPVVDEKGKEKCIMVELCFDWDSGKLLREPATKAPRGLGRALQYSADDML